MHSKLGSCGIALAVASLASVQPIQAAKQARTKVVACTLIHTPAQLQEMQNNLAGSYCLANEGSRHEFVANFVPIGRSPTFTGKFFGKGHAIRNLTINVSTPVLCSVVCNTENAVFKDVRLVNVNITASNGNAAGLVGFIEASLGQIPVQCQASGSVER